jgi:uncharacterized protein YdhG (YjbR/CyaY superfamily)
MPTFALPRFLAHHAEQRHHAQELTNTITGTDTNIRKRIQYVDPADTLTLRGIPAIGRGVAGHIRHTQPETAATR